MFRKNTRYVILLVLLIGSIVLLVTGYHESHRKYAGQSVVNLCAGGYIPVPSSNSVNGGGPCLSSNPYILKNDDRLYDVSLVLIGLAVGSGITLFFADTKKPKRLKRK
ncbi:MAG TPA: hypothetical protein VHB72_01910 [Candidatus Saccharimonadales bacterium]|nr:hypothetical protein [Candidatus Saccharimonadales bacterium]